MSMFTFVDFFAGVGGFHQALASIGGECVASAEINDFSRKTYELNFKKKSGSMFENGYFFRDITKIDGSQLPNHQIMCGGFPCQAFSIAGHRKGFEDTRGTLFFDVVRLAKEKQPEVLFLENVKNLTSHDSGNTFKVIIETIEKLGYHVHYKVLNTSVYTGIPQNRERIFIIGFKQKEVFDKFEFPSPIPLNLGIDDLLEKNKVDKKYYYEGKPLFDRIKGDINQKNTCYQWRRQYVRENKSGVCPTLTANMGTGGHNVPIVLDDFGIRKLTPRETFLLQGFPKTYKLPDIADSHLYQQAGNAVTVKLIQRIGEKIIHACGW